MSPPATSPNTKSAPLLRGIDRLIWRVPNVPAAVAFYRDTMGLSVVRDGTSYATLEFSDGRQVLLHNDPDLPEEATLILVDDVKALFARRRELRLDFASPPTRGSKGFRATMKDPFGTVLLVIDRTLETPASEPVEDVLRPDALFPGVTPKFQVKIELLAELYEKAGRTADDLPYTAQFEQIYEAYAKQWPGPQPGRAEVWRHLLSVRKKGKLPKLGQARSKPPAIDGETAERIRRLMAEHIGETIGRRDRLPYSKPFDDLADAFNRERVSRHESPMTPHALWRIVASLAK